MHISKIIDKEITEKYNRETLILNNPKNLDEIDLGAYHYLFEKKLITIYQSYLNEYKEVMNTNFDNKRNTTYLDCINNIKKLDDISKNKLAEMLDKKVELLFSSMWDGLNNESKKINECSLLEYYDLYYKKNLTTINMNKDSIINKLKIYIEKSSTQKKNTSINISIDESKKILQKLNIKHSILNDSMLEKADKFSLIYQHNKCNKIQVSVDDPFYNQKLFHEIGHFLHQENMYQKLSYINRYFHNLVVTEAIAILFQFIYTSQEKNDFLLDAIPTIWWEFVEYYSLIQFLEKDTKINSRSIVNYHSKKILGTRYDIPGAVRTFKVRMESARYIIAFFTAIGIFNEFKKDSRILKEIMFFGGNYNYHSFFHNGLKYFLNIKIN